MRILIETARGFEKSPFYDIVYEWEDVLTEKLGDARLSYRSKFENDLLRATQKIGFLNIAPCHPTGSSDVRIRFDMLPRQNNDFRNHYNTVPWLIDFSSTRGITTAFTGPTKDIRWYSCRAWRSMTCLRKADAR